MSNNSERFQRTTTNKVSKESLSVQLLALRNFFQNFEFFCNFHMRCILLRLIFFLIFFFPKYMLQFNNWGLKGKDTKLLINDSKEDSAVKNFYLRRKLIKGTKCLRRGEPMPNFYDFWDFILFHENNTTKKFCSGGTYAKNFIYVGT